MCVMQFHSIKARFARAPCGIRKNLGELLRQLPHVWKLHIGHVLAVTEAKRFQLACVQYTIDNFFIGAIEKIPHFTLVGINPSRVLSYFCECPAMSIFY